MNSFRWLIPILLGSTLLLGTSGTPLVNVQHSAHLKVGSRDVRFDFTDYPIRAKRSLDFIFAPTNGSIDGLKGHYRLIQPDNQVGDEADFLPHYPRDRHFWGLDSQALDTPGLWKFELTIGKDTASLPIQVGPAPAGPPASLISLLALTPLAFLLVLATLAWRRVRPLRQVDSRAW